MARLRADSALGKTAAFGVHGDVEVLLLIIFTQTKRKFSFLLRYGAASVGNWCQAFSSNPGPSSSREEMPKQNQGQGFLGILVCLP